MIFSPTPLAGAYLLDIEPVEDERGYFARTFCVDELRAQGLDAAMVQASISSNARRGTLRGLHFQAEPYTEAKLISAVTGAIHDVIVDVRPGSPTFARSFAVRLDARSHRALFVPRGFAHGFQTLEDNTTVAYQISERYRPEAARGIRFNDPMLGIAWPIDAAILSARDRELPRLSELRL